MSLVWRLLPAIVLLALAALAVILSIVPLEALFARVPINYDEGWNAFHTLRLRQGGPLYPPISEAVFINYTPLSFYVVAALHPLFGDDIFAGRFVALLAELVVTLNVALAARALGARWMLAGIAAAGFFVFVASLFADYVGMDDPQWLGHALQTSALVLLLHRNRLDWVTLAAVALLLLLGGLVKQNLVALPLALTLWLAVVDRRALLRWLVCAGGMAAIALAGLVALYGQGFVDQVIRSERSYWGLAVKFFFETLAIDFAPFELFAAAGSILMRPDRRAGLIGAYLAVALFAGVGMMAINGVVYNALFDLCIAMTIGSAMMVEWGARRLADMPRWRPASASLAALVFALPSLALARDFRVTYPDLQRDLARQEAWQQTIATIRDANGPVACETLSLCYWAGRSSEIDFFNFGQLAGLHPAFANALEARLASGALALIQEEFKHGASRRFPAAVNAAINQRYRMAQTDPTTLLVPQ